MSEISSYRDLRVWQSAVEFAVKIYEATPTFPNSEIYGLTTQMRHAAVSIPSNIAEGHTRSQKEFAHFLTRVLSSLAELETQLEIAQRIGFLPEDDFEILSDELSAIGKPLNVLIRRIKDRG